MTVIEIRPLNWGWKCFEAPDVEPIFSNQQDAIDYATGRACFRSGEIRVIRFDRQIRTHKSAQRSSIESKRVYNEFLKEHRKVEQQRKGFEAAIARLQKQVETLTAGLQKVTAQLELSKAARQTVLNNR